MTRRTVAPVLLLLAAAASIAAVFAVHALEEGGGPLAEPWATRTFAPGFTEATVRMSTRAPERITIRIVEANGAGDTVRTLLTDRRVDGPLIEHWDGRNDAGAVVPDGDYLVEIERAGDSRVYAPARPITVDTVPPVAVLERAAIVNGTLNAYAHLGPDTRVRVLAGNDDAEPLGGLRTWRSSNRLDPDFRAPRGTTRYSISVAIPSAARPLEDVRILAVDAAGNELDMLAADGAPRIQVRS